MTVAKLENMCMISTLKNGKRYAEWSKLYSLTVVTTGENSCVLQIQCSDHKLLYSLTVVTTGENNCVLQIQCSDHKLLYSLTVVTTGENNCVLQIQCSDHKLLYSLAVVTTGENNCVLQCSDHKLLHVQSDNLHLQMTACSPPQTNNSTQCQAMLTQRHNG